MVNGGDATKKEPEVRQEVMLLADAIHTLGDMIAKHRETIAPISIPRPPEGSGPTDVGTLGPKRMTDMGQKVQAIRAEVLSCQEAVVDCTNRLEI